IRGCSSSSRSSQSRARPRSRRGRSRVATVNATAFVGGAVFDGYSYVGRAEVLVRDGQVVEVSATVDRSGAQVVDLAGGLLAPGFVDAPVHAVQGGLERIRCDLSDGT